VFRNCILIVSQYTVSERDFTLLTPLVASKCASFSLDFPWGALNGTRKKARFEKRSGSFV
jgi:hypothetical protein